MSPAKRGHSGDPIEQAMELALRLGNFIDYGASWSFVSGLKEVESDIEKLPGAEPERAVDLCETFVAGCYEKAEEARSLKPGRLSSTAPSVERGVGLGEEDQETTAVRKIFSGVYQMSWIRALASQGPPHCRQSSTISR